MEFTTELYKAYKGLVYSKAIELSEVYGVDQEMLISEGMIIFTKATQTFDCERKVAFSTYLYHQLRSLEHKAKMENKVTNRYFYGYETDNADIGSAHDQNYKDYNEGFFEQAIATIDFSEEKYNLLHDIALQLSEDAKIYLFDLFKGVHTKDIDPKGGAHTKQSDEKIAEYYNWSLGQSRKIKSEIKVWWADYKIAM